ncbi:hypothetical protein WL34_02945 [Burkholderia cepacia]|nr:hypothetical protein WL34_02945 [Burkholderia cepacia]
MLSESLDELQRLLGQRDAMRFLCFHASAWDRPNPSKEIELIPRRTADLTTSGRSKYQEQQGCARAVGRIVFREMVRDEFGDLALGHGRLVLRFS